MAKRAPFLYGILFANQLTVSMTVVLKVTQVKDPSKYGVVVADKSGRIERFVEKPTGLSGNCMFRNR